MVKIKRPKPLKIKKPWSNYVCGGCGYEYDPELGDAENEIYPVTTFDKLPEEWNCPFCDDPKEEFIEVK